MPSPLGSRFLEALYDAVVLLQLTTPSACPCGRQWKPIEFYYELLIRAGDPTAAHVSVLGPISPVEEILTKRRPESCILSLPIMKRTPNAKSGLQPC